MSRSSEPVSQPGDGPPPSRRSPGPAVAIRGLDKRYGGVQALAGMNLEVHRGHIHAVVGENGAGKSTLMKILAGAVHADRGEIELDGQPATIASPKDAAAHGIGIVYQELSLFPTRSTLANIFVLREPTRYGLVSRREMRRLAASVLAQIGLRVDLDRPVSELPIGERQLIEICRVLLTEPRVIILDEPNSALSERETRRLFGVLRQLAGRGITMLYVSHRLEEVFEIADRITVMRNGREVLTRDRAELTIPQVIEGMIGRQQDELFPPPLERSGDAGGTLAVRGLSVGGALRDVSFEVRAGEIVGLAGVEGSGVSLLLGVLFGTTRATSGDVVYPDTKGLPHTTTAAARRGISLVPADRRRQGLMLEKAVATNIAHVAVGAMRSRQPWLPRSQLLEAANRQIRDLQIKTQSPWTPVNQLSGGNQQKVVVGKWLEIGPKVVLLDDPTRGVDVGAKREIFAIMRRLAAEGRVLLFRSTELPELIGMCDRILVFYRGRLVGEVAGEALDGRTLLHAINTGDVVGETDVSPTGALPLDADAPSRDVAPPGKARLRRENQDDHRGGDT
jgi:ribose transport system ATP-binding protein